MSRAHNSLDLTGRRFGDLTVLRYAGTRRCAGGDCKSRWVCRCDCSRRTTVDGSSLTTGNTKSCGNCRIRTAERGTHGGHGTRTYRIWQAMHNRCRNPNQPNYANYGGRGIRVCERWSSFQAFWDDMGWCPPRQSLDRINNDGDYTPENCRWATRREQGRNRRTNRMITFRGETLCLKDWADRLGIDQASLRERLDKWPLERALTQRKRGATPPADRHTDREEWMRQFCHHMTAAGMERNAAVRAAAHAYEDIDRDPDNPSGSAEIAARLELEYAKA